MISLQTSGFQNTGLVCSYVSSLVDMLGNHMKPALFYKYGGWKFNRFSWVITWLQNWEISENHHEGHMASGNTLRFSIISLFNSSKLTDVPIHTFPCRHAMFFHWATLSQRKRTLCRIYRLLVAQRKAKASWDIMKFPLCSVYAQIIHKYVCSMSDSSPNPGCEYRSPRRRLCQQCNKQHD